MAATTRIASPETEPFPTLDAGPQISTPGIPTSHARAAPGAVDNPNILRNNSPRTSDKSGGTLSPRPGKLGFAGNSSPVPLTGAAAMADLRKHKQQQQQQQQQRSAREDRETSTNPALQAMQTLLGAGGISRPSDAPTPNKLSEPMQKVAQKMNISPANAHGVPTRGSPSNLASAGTIETTGTSAMTATANSMAPASESFVAEPMEMSDPRSFPSDNNHLAVTSDQDGPKAFSYPGPPPQDHGQDGPSRGMSLPGYGQGSPKSPSSNKRHKCPYCETDFTRHHNLKSHLLTHSQEKPYVCQTCQARFRRLHDLKRHTKLHTGERPHICDKCGRRFARGDALARHNKGPGGCAGRRSSFGGDDDGFDGEGGGEMDGVEYTDGDDGGESPGQGRRGSEPSRKRVHLETPHDPQRDVYRQQSSTYPPVQQGRPHANSGGSMAPPQVVLAGSATVNSPREMSNQASPTAGGSMSSAYYATPGQVFAQQGGITESPKPLSPGQAGQDPHRLSVGDASAANIRNRSPSLTTQFQQAHFGRGSSLNQFAAHHGAPNAPPLLPPPTNQTGSRSGFQGTSAPGPGPSSLQHHSLPPTSAHTGGIGSNPGSLSSHGRSSGSSMRDVMQDPGDIWAYVRSLEQRMSRMQDEYELRISRLSEEVIQLRGQATSSYSSDMGQPRY